MFQSNAYVLNQAQLRTNAGQGDQPLRIALHKHRDARVQAWWDRLLSALTGRSRSLLHLDTVRATCTIRRSHYAGMRSVPICQIRGSEGRCDDFDADFRPLQSHSRGRWVSVAVAQLKGVTLPAVDLIQIGDVYFVRDGHHRISVGRAMGQEIIDAEVTVWEVAGPLPWERATLRGEMVLQPA